MSTNPKPKNIVPNPLTISPAKFLRLEARLLSRRGYNLRLMSSVKDTGDIPSEGKKLIIVAVVDQVLCFRIFDGDGKMVVDTNETRLTKKVRLIECLRKQLASLWPPHELAGSEKGRVIDAVTSIVGYSCRRPRNDRGPAAKPVPPATRAKRLAISRPPIFKPALALAMKSEESARSVRTANSAAPAAIDEAKKALGVLDTLDLERFLVRDFQREIEDQRAEIAEMEAS